MPKKYEHKFSAKFKGYSSGTGAATFGMNLDRERGLDDLAEIFIGSHLECELTCDLNSGGDVEGQQTLSGKQNETIKLSGDTKGFIARSDHIGISLSMNKDTVDANLLGRFSGLRGKLKLNVLELAASDDGEE